MGTQSTRGRHRVAGRPKTPLTAITDHLVPAGAVTAIAATAAGIMIPSGLAHAMSSPPDPKTTKSTTELFIENHVLTTIYAAPANARWSGESAIPQLTVENLAPAQLSPKTGSVPFQASPEGELAGTGVPQDAPADNVGAQIVAVAKRYLGVPYVYGGSSPAGFDCSGLVKYVYAQEGISLPHQSESIKATGTVVPAAQARPGDVLWTPGHVAIYAGGDMEIEAPARGLDVRLVPIWQARPTFVHILGA